MERPGLTLLLTGCWCETRRSFVTTSVCNCIYTIVERVKALNVGCYIICICCSIFLYADDILLLAPTISGLRALLNTCENYLNDVDMRINANKSQCIRFGRRYNIHCAALTLSPVGPSIGLTAVVI